MTTVTLLDNMTIVNVDGMEASRFEHLVVRILVCLAFATWGEAGTVKLKMKSTPKIGNRGEQ